MKKEHLKIAGDVADGAEVDWDTQSNDPLVQNLQRIAAIAQAYGHPGESGGSKVTETEDLASGNALFTWGHLQVMELMAKGSFGEVYRAFDPVLEREVALKLRHPRSFSMPSSSYIQEARRLARVRHPNVLAVHGAGHHNDRVGLWCDLIEGTTLTEKLRDEGPLDPDRVVSWAIGLSDALARVHEAGMVHCDVKSSNVMLGRDGRIVLMDFGAGNEITANHKQEISFGTPLYMAPELFQGHSPHTGCDIYSLGVLLFQMLTKRFPIEAKSVPEIIGRHVVGKRRDLREARPGLPRHLTDLVTACLSPDPANRPSAGELAAKLRWIAEMPARRVKQRLRLGLIIALCLGLAFSSWGYFTAKRETRRAQRAKDQAQAVHDFLVNMLAAPAPLNQGRDVKVLDVLDSARAEIDTKFANRPMLKASIMYTLGLTFGRLSDHRKAMELLTAAYDMQMELFGPRDPRTLHTRFALGECHLRVGDLAEAEALLVPCLESCREILGTGHILTANAAIRVSYLLCRQTHLKEAEALLREVLSWRVSTPGAEDGKVLLAIINLADLYITGGRYAEAETLLKDLLAGPIAARGGANVIVARGALGVALMQAGKLQEAETLLRENMAVARKVLGPENTNVISCQANLALVLENMGRPEEAQTQLDEAQALVERKFGPDHSETIKIKMNRANLLRTLGRRLEAEAIHRELLPRHRKIYGKDHPQTGMVLFNLAEILAETDRVDEALTLARQARTIFTNAYGEEHHFSIEADGLIGFCYLSSGRVDEALPILEQVLAAKKRTLEESSPYLLNTLEHLVRAYREAGQMDKARQTAQYALERHRALFGEDNPKTREAEQLVASFPSR